MKREMAPQPHKEIKVLESKLYSFDIKLIIFMFKFFLGETCEHTYLVSVFSHKKKIELDDEGSIPFFFLLFL